MENPTDIARRSILSAMLAHVPFDGWTAKSLKTAVKDAKLPKGSDALYFPDGPLEVIRFWSDEMNQDVATSLSQLDLGTMKIRDKVTQGVLARLKAMDGHAEAAKRAMARLTLPDAAGEGAKQLWAAADVIWRAIGDTSTDANYYSKRTILSGVIGSSTTAWLADDSEDKNRGRAFLDNRIANVMQFEKLKWTVKNRTKNWPNPAAVLGRLRYGGRRRRRR